MHLARVAAVQNTSTQYSLRNNGTESTDITYGFLYF